MVVLWKVKVKSLSHVRLFAAPWTVAYQTPPPIISRQEYWSGFAISYSRGSSQPMDQIQVSLIAGRFFTVWATIGSDSAHLCIEEINTLLREADPPRRCFARLKTLFYFTSSLPLPLYFLFWLLFLIASLSLSLSSIQAPMRWFSSFAQSCLTLCDPMNCSTSGLPVYHQLPEFTQTHVHQVGDAIQPSHPLSSPSPPAPNPSQHQSLFQWVNSAWGGQSIGVSALASFLLKKSQGWFPSEWTGWISLQSKGLSRVFSNTTFQKHQFFSTQLSSQSNSYIHTWTLEKP